MIRHFELYTTELQILNPGGQVLSTSTGFEIEQTIKTSDVTQALAGNTGHWIGSEGTGQIVMAVSQTVSNGFEKTYILRYVTSLEFINDKLMKITLFAVSIGGAVLALVLAFSIGLANSIVKPLNNITTVSAQMAKGRFNVRIKGDYKYELGELSSTLNYMAQEIVRSNQVKDDFVSSISHECGLRSQALRAGVKRSTPVAMIRKKRRSGCRLFLRKPIV